MLLKLPERVDGRLARTFARELNRELMNDRPRIVVDLSQVKQIDSDALNTLLDCMVEVANRDGAVSWAGFLRKLQRFWSLRVWIVYLKCFRLWPRRRVASVLPGWSQLPSRLRSMQLRK